MIITWRWNKWALRVTRGTIVQAEFSGAQPFSKEEDCGSQPSSCDHCSGTQQPDADEHEVLDFENRKNSEKCKGRTEMAPRSDMWNHFIKIKDENNANIAILI